MVLKEHTGWSSSLVISGATIDNLIPLVVFGSLIPSGAKRSASSKLGWTHLIPVPPLTSKLQSARQAIQGGTMIHTSRRGGYAVLSPYPCLGDIRWSLSK